MSLVVVEQGPHWAVLDKPAGMTVVAGRGVPRPTLLDLAVERWPDARPVHRLDKPTTGCCVVAKSAFGQQALSDAFRRHIIDKRYVAIVVGLPAWEKLDVDARLARVDDPDLPASVKGALKGKKTLSIQTVDEEAGVRALTRFKVLARGDGVTLIECRPETGRMHQIRCHLAHVGFPLVGDALYGAAVRFIDGQDVALHALCLSFPRPEGGRGFVTTRLPSTWAKFLKEKRLDTAGVDEARVRFLKPVAQAAQAQLAAAQQAAQQAGRPSRGDGRNVRGTAKPAPKTKPSSSSPRPSKPPRPSAKKGPPRSSPLAGSARSSEARRGDRRSR